MPAFLIRKAKKKKEFTNSHGTFHVYELTLEAEDQSHVVADLVQKPETAEPAAGSELRGTLEDSQYGKRFKKEQQQRGGGGRAPDPKRDTQITHMHAQKCALSYAHLRQAQGKLPDEFGLPDLFAIAAKFRADVESVTP